MKDHNGFAIEKDGSYIADEQKYDWMADFEYEDYSDGGLLKRWAEIEDVKIPYGKYRFIILKEKK